MNTVKRKPARAKGAVLIMVLTIMTVLILLLAGTISVVYSSHNRALKKYTESQAYYTARSVIDEYLDDMLKDNTTDSTEAGGSGSRKYFYVGTNATTGAAEQKNDVELKQGRALELDLYRVPVSTVTTATDPNYNEWYDKEIDDKLTSLTDAQKKLYVNIPGSTSFSDYSTFSGYYNQFITGTDWPSSGVMGKDDVLTYKVSSLDSFGEDSSTSKRYGQLASRGSTSTITVQVLERKFDLGTGATFAEQFNNGDRSKDYFKIKVTSEVHYQPNSNASYGGSADTDQVFRTSTIIKTRQVNPPGASNAIVSLSSIEGDDTVTAFGGLSSLTRSNSAWTNNANTSSNLYFQGSIDTGTTTPKFYLNENNIMFVRGELDMKNCFDFSKVKTGATFYAKTFDLQNNNAKFGDSSHKPNILGEKLIIRDKASEIHGQVIVNELDYFVSQNTNGATTLHGPETAYCKFLGLKKGEGVHYEMSGSDLAVRVHYSDLTNTISDINADFTQTISGKITITDGFVLYNSSGDPEYMIDVRNTSGVAQVYQWSNITNNWLPQSLVGLDLVVDPAVTSKIVLDTTVTDFNMSYDHPYGGTTDPGFTMTADFKKEYTTLPCNLLGSGVNKITFDTVQSLYGTYFLDNTTSGTYAGDTWDTYGDFNSALNGGWDISDDTQVEAFVQEHVKTSEAILGTTNLLDLSSNTTIGSRDASREGSFPTAKQIPASYSNVISSDTRLSLNFGTVAVDTRDGEVNVVIGDGTGGEIVGTLVVYGDNNCNIILPANNTNTEYSFGSGGSPFQMYDADLGALVPYQINIEGKSPATPAPNINVFAGVGVTKIICTQQTPVIQGYVYAPSARFTLGGGNNGNGMNINNNDHSNLASNSVSVIGSVFCKSYGGSQKPGVCYIDPSVTALPQGQTLFNWNIVRRQVA